MVDAQAPWGCTRLWVIASLINVIQFNVVPPVRIVNGLTLDTTAPHSFELNAVKEQFVNFQGSEIFDAISGLRSPAFEEPICALDDRQDSQSRYRPAYPIDLAGQAVTPNSSLAGIMLFPIPEKEIRAIWSILTSISLEILVPPVPNVPNDADSHLFGEMWSDSYFSLCFG